MCAAITWWVEVRHTVQHSMPLPHNRVSQLQILTGSTLKNQFNQTRWIIDNRNMLNREKMDFTIIWESFNPSPFLSPWASLGNDIIFEADLLALSSQNCPGIRTEVSPGVIFFASTQCIFTG